MQRVITIELDVSYAPELVERLLLLRHEQVESGFTRPRRGFLRVPQARRPGELQRSAVPEVL